jgi:hypothetical protein
MRTLMLLVTAVCALALSVPAAFGTSGTSSTVDGITVSVSLTDQAIAGQPFTITESIANSNTRPKLVRVTQTLTGPAGVVFSIRYPVIVPAGKTLAFSITYTFPANVPLGTYRLTLSAGGATAFAETEVVSPAEQN